MMRTEMEDIRPGGRATGPDEDIASRAGSALRSAAGRLRSSGALEREGLERLRFLQRGLDSVGEYLERRKLPGLRLDAERLIVARPLVAVVAAAAVGYLAGRAVRR
jgi:hypothetical protein